ncbi:MAG: hypothetical protein Q7T55_06185 [Solirubrobacteraceae bacterium]|nr:hypothetical protein [Solirubrobacteraceae bacterium]
MTQIGASTSASVVDQASLPASVRNASTERKEQYAQAQAFERVLLGQLTEAMMATTGSDKDAPAAVKAMKDQLPGMLADALGSSGGLGLAKEFDEALHPDSQVKKTSLSGSDVTGATPATAATGTSAGGATA